MSGTVTVTDSYVLGPEGIPFFTKEVGARARCCRFDADITVDHGGS